MGNSTSELSKTSGAAPATVALVTGASSGIGAAFARLLAARGKHLVLVARSKDKLDALAREIASQHSRRVEVIDQDLSTPGAAERVATFLNDRAITVDLLVNNAGFGAQGEFWRVPLDRQLEMIRLNIVALTELTYKFLPAMVERRGGSIINVSSTAGLQPVPYTSVYAATKAYVTSFSMGLAEEVSRYGVRVLALCPGGTATNFFDASRFSKRDFAGGLQSPDDVVKAALRALDAGRSFAITRFLDRLMDLGERVSPRRFVARQAGEMFRPKGL